MEKYIENGYVEPVTDTDAASSFKEGMKEYWGGMLSRGASTFWEEFKPSDSEEEQYGMYGDKYGKSLCHAWGASPIYLIGRYFLGIKPKMAGYETFEAAPDIELLDCFSCEMPVNEGFIRMESDESVLSVFTNRDGGFLVIKDREYPIEKNKMMNFEIICKKNQQ